MSGTPAPLKFHLGCGKRYIPRFVHVDLEDFPYIDHRVSIARLPMFADESAELIYCCHALPYFDRKEALGCLREWHRVLRPGGTLRLSVSDFEVLVRLYQANCDLSDILRSLFGRIETRTPDGPAVLYYRTTYDFPSLERLLVEAGFGSVRRYDWRETIHRDSDDFSQAYR